MVVWDKMGKDLIHTIGRVFQWPTTGDGLWRDSAGAAPWWQDWAFRVPNWDAIQRSALTYRHTHTHTHTQSFPLGWINVSDWLVTLIYHIVGFKEHCWLKEAVAILSQHSAPEQGTWSTWPPSTADSLLRQAQHLALRGDGRLPETQPQNPAHRGE